MQIEKAYQSCPAKEYVYWPKWGTTDVYKFDFTQNDWQPVLGIDGRKEVPFLHYSSIVTLPKEMGLFILGGTDVESNFSDGSIFFNKYEKMIEMPPMVQQRGFFPSCFCIDDSSIYVFGGRNQIADLAYCEKFVIC